jgi:hypothetical protein
MSQHPYKTFVVGQKTEVRQRKQAWDYIDYDYQPKNQIPIRAVR